MTTAANLRTWKLRIASFDSGTPIQKSLIQAICRIHRDNTRPRIQFREQSTELGSELLKLFQREFRWKITEPQTKQGIEWLRRKPILRKMSPFQREVVESFRKFEFVGVSVTEPNYYRIDASPIYRVIGSGGQSFDYVPMPWQSGNADPFRIVRERKSIDWTRIKNDVNGNPRYVCHFLEFITERDSVVPLTEKYALAVRRANKIGGRRFHTKAYGGGIVFQSYSLDELTNSVHELMERKVAE